MKWMAGALLVVVLSLQYRLWMSGDGVRELAMARWGMPSSQFALLE